MIKPVNQSQSVNPRSLGANGPNQSADPRLYLRDSELDQAAALVRRAARNLRESAIKTAGNANIIDAAIDVLIEISSMEGCDVAQLRAHMQAPKQSLNRNLNILEENGLIKRTPCPRDARRRRLMLSEDGKKLVEDAANGWRALLLDAFRKAGPDNVSSARNVLFELAKSSTRNGS